MFTDQTTLPHLPSFQLWLESSGRGLGKQQLRCILVVILFFNLKKTKFIKKHGDPVSIDVHFVAANSPFKSELKSGKQSDYVK